MKNIILYADDDNTLSRLYRSFHEKNYPEYKLVIHEDGNSLKNSLEELAENVVLVLTDNNMPETKGLNVIDGFGLKIIEKFAKDPRYSHIKFILSYGGDKIIGEEAMKNGAFAYILKPYSIKKDLKSPMDRALGIKRDITSS